jgi:RNA polymerase sigma-70 factor, ECF subfamily
VKASDGQKQGSLGGAANPDAAGAAAEDAQLLKGLRERRHNALAATVQHHGATLMRAAFLYLRDGHSAEDAVQETFLAAWDSAGRTGPTTSLKSWLLGILANRCRKHIRSARRRRQREDAVAGMAGRSVNQPQDGEELAALQDALDRLDGDHRAVVILRFWQGLSIEETADALKVPPGTVKSRSHVAVQRLREWMRSEDGRA